MGAYYNENDAYAAQWLRNLIDKGLIAKGDVDDRSIIDVAPDDVRKFTQCHFFAGIGGWSHALRLAGWPDDRRVWTGSCPCQPFSVAGKGLGVDDPRHLWPHFHRLIAADRPPVVFGEQVSGAAGYGWLDGVRSDLARENYACEGFDIPACAVDAPHIRNRLYWCASAVDHADDARLEGHAGDEPCAAQGRREPRRSAAASGVRGDMADADNTERRPQSEGWRDDNDRQDTGRKEASGGHQLDRTANGTFWSDHIWLTGADGKARRAQPGLPLLAHGIPARVGRLRAYGNAIVPQIAAEVIGAYLDVRP